MTGGVFAHCSHDPDETWKTFYSLACLCHPSQGGYREEMAELCRQARHALGEDGWPEAWRSHDALPNLFDIFCTATKRDNPFGSLTRSEQQEPCSAFEVTACCPLPLADVPGYRCAGAPFAPLSSLGAVELVFCAARAAAEAADESS